MSPILRTKRDNPVGTDPGARADTEGIRYVAIGDSVPRGFRLAWPRLGQRDSCGITLTGVPLRWFDNPNDGYPAYVAAELRRVLDRPVELDMTHTCSGVTTAHFWSANAPTDRLLSAMLRPADLVTVTLGANDMLGVWARYLIASGLVRPFRRFLPRDPVGNALERLAPDPSQVSAVAAGVEHRLGQIVTWIHERSPTARIVVTSYYSGDGRAATRDGFARPLLEAVRAAASCCDAATLVDVDPLFGDTEERASRTDVDGMHPSAALQARIGSVVANAALSQLSRR